jgi:hypothetical protein
MRITTRAGSGLGHVLALAIVVIPLVIMGLYLALGDVSAGDTGRMRGLINRVFAAKSMQDMGRVLSESVGAHFRGFGRVELLVYYGLAIVLGFVIQGWLGRFLRSYRFAFLPREGVIERRAVWLFVPGGRKRVAFSRIKRMEVVAEMEGGTALVVTIGDGRTWVICRGMPAKLQRLGGALGRVMKLERRDVVTWAGR